MPPWLVNAVVIWATKWSEDRGFRILLYNMWREEFRKWTSPCMLYALLMGSLGPRGGQSSHWVCCSWPWWHRDGQCGSDFNELSTLSRWRTSWTSQVGEARAFVLRGRLWGLRGACHPGSGRAPGQSRGWNSSDGARQHGPQLLWIHFSYIITLSGNDARHQHTSELHKHSTEAHGRDCLLLELSTHDCKQSTLVLLLLSWVFIYLFVLRRT